MEIVLSIENIIISLSSLILGALLSSYFSWVYFKKQKRAEIQINEAKAIHNQIYKVNMAFSDAKHFIDVYMEIRKTDMADAHITLKEHICPQIEKISDNLMALAENFNYARHILEVNTKEVSKINNTWGDLVDKIFENEVPDDMVLHETRNFIKNSVDILDDMVNKILYSSYEQIYTPKQRLIHSLEAYKNTKNKKEKRPIWLDKAASMLLSILS